MIKKALLTTWLTALSACVALGQATNFTIRVAPPDGTILVTETTNAVAVTIGNFDQFTNVTMVGTFGIQTNIQFLDQGTPPDVDPTNGTFSAFIITPLVTVGTTQELELVITGELIPPDPPPDPLPPPLVSTNRVKYFIVPRPVNDKFTNAFKVLPDGETIIATNNYASLEAREPRHAQVSTVDASVWWKWPAQITGNVLVDTSGSSFDTVLAVYSGSTVSNLTLIKAATNGVAAGLRAQVNFNATAGVTYRIAVSGVDTNAVGDIYLRIVPGGQPDIVGPITSITTPAAESLFTTNLVMFRGTAKDVEPFGSGVKEVLLTINNGLPTNALGTTDWSASLVLPPGTNVVRAFAKDWAGNIGRSSSIVVRFVNPTNDFFNSATELLDVGGVVTAVNERATREVKEPFHAGNEGGHSIWYWWRAPFSGELFVSTGGSSFDTLLGIYVGSALTNLIQVASNDDANPGAGYSQTTIQVVANQIYYIAVDGLGGEYGDVVLRYSFTTSANFFGLSIVSSLGGAVSPPSDLYPANAVVLLTAIPDKNYEFVRWQNSAGTFSSTRNPLTLVMSQNYSMQAIFRVTAYTDTFKSGDFTKLPWSGAGNELWTIDTAGGQFVARSGRVNDRQSSSLVLTTNMFAGTGAFDLRVSSEEGWDWLEFYVNGNRLGRWSGEVAWQNFLFAVPGGLTTLEWRYVKDANFSKGADAAFVDNIYIPLERPETQSPNPVLSLGRTLSGDLQVILQGFPNVPYAIEASTNLTDWLSVATNISPGVTSQFIDVDARRLPRRFYRAFQR